MRVTRGNSKKLCDKCQQTYSGFGTTCGTCRKVHLKKGGIGGSALACATCGEYFFGFGSVCRDCQKKEAGEVDFPMHFKKPGRSFSRAIKEGDVVETLSKGGIRWVAQVIKVRRDGSLQLSGGMTRRPDQVHAISTRGADVYVGLMIKVKGSDEPELNGEEGVCESWDQKTNKMQIRLQVGEVKSVDVKNLDLIAPQDDNMTGPQLLAIADGKVDATAPVVIDAAGYLAALNTFMANLLLENARSRPSTQESVAIHLSQGGGAARRQLQQALPGPIEDAEGCSQQPGRQLTDMQEQKVPLALQDTVRGEVALAPQITLRGEAPLALQDSEGCSQHPERQLTQTQEQKGTLLQLEDAQCVGVAEDSETGDETTDQVAPDDGRNWTVVAPGTGKPVRCTEAEATVELERRRTQLASTVARDTSSSGSRLDVLITIVGAKNLRDADWGPFGGKSDPYVVGAIANKSESRFKTRVLNDTVNPEWNHTATFLGMERQDTVVFRLFDKDFGKKDDFLGQCTIQPVLSLQFYGGNFESEVPLWDAGKGIDAKLRLRIKEI